MTDHAFMRATYTATIVWNANSDSLVPVPNDGHDAAVAARVNDLQTARRNLIIERIRWKMALKTKRWVIPSGISSCKMCLIANAFTLFPLDGG
jgi:hypothetical protein